MMAVNKPFVGFLEALFPIPIHVISYLSECHYFGSPCRLLFFVWKHSISLRWLVFVVNYRRVPSQSTLNKESRCLPESIAPVHKLHRIKKSTNSALIIQSAGKAPSAWRKVMRACSREKTQNNCFSRSDTPANEACQEWQPCPICSLAFWVKRCPRAASVSRRKRRRRVLLARAHPATLSSRCERSGRAD